MQFDWDDRKARTNEAKHGLAFEAIEAFEIITALVVEDDRFDYGEKRLVGIGLIGADVCTAVFTERDDKVRLISLRKANRKEIEAYVENL